MGCLGMRQRWHHQSQLVPANKTPKTGLVYSTSQTTQKPVRTGVVAVEVVTSVELIKTLALSTVDRIQLRRLNSMCKNAISRVSNVFISEHGRHAEGRGCPARVFCWTTRNQPGQRIDMHWLTCRCEPQNQLIEFCQGGRTCETWVWNSEFADLLLGRSIVKAHGIGVHRVRGGRAQ